MQQTEIYKLNLIETGDTFSPQPLNENMEKVETALEGLHQQIDDRIVAGTYTGTGSTERTISLDFTPKLVILFGNTFVGFFTDNLGYGIGKSSAGTIGCRTTENGFIATNFNTNETVYTYFAIP